VYVLVNVNGVTEVDCLFNVHATLKRESRSSNTYRTCAHDTTAISSILCKALYFLGPHLMLV